MVICDLLKYIDRSLSHRWSNKIVLSIWVRLLSGVFILQDKDSHMSLELRHNVLVILRRK